MTDNLRTWLLAAAVALLGPSCVISPLPEPPQVTLDPNLLTGDGGSYGPVVAGNPGAASPEGAIVRAYNLNSDSAPQETVVAANGSFYLELETEDFETEVRLQVLTDDSRSHPVDIIVTIGFSELQPAPRPLSDCLTLNPTAELDLASAQEVLVTNHCGEDVELLAPSLRNPSADLEVGQDESWPATLADGDSITVSVVAGPTLAEESIFFIEASAPERDRRPITVIPRP